MSSPSSKKRKLSIEKDAAKVEGDGDVKLQIRHGDIWYEDENMVLAREGIVFKVILSVVRSCLMLTYFRLIPSGYAVFESVTMHCRKP